MAVRDHSWLNLGLRWLPLGVLLAYWALLIHHLGAQWSVYDQYGYGWAVPLLCAYLIWQRLGKGDTGEPPVVAGNLPDARPPARASAAWWLPICLIVLCALLYAPTRFLHEANPIWRLTSWAWTLLVIGITLFFLSLLQPPARSAAPSPREGERVSAGPRRGISWATRLAFPICFFLVAVPWPTIAEVWLVETLTGLNVAVTIELLNAFGIPALQHGNLIEITTGVVGVDEACSGIRSFQATLMLSLFFGDLYSLTVGRRIFLCLLGFASSFVFNVGRTFILTYVASRQGVPAIEKWHDPAGVTILVWCFVVLWFMALVLKPERRREKEAAPNTDHRTSHLEPPGSAGICADKGQAGQQPCTQANVIPAKGRGDITSWHPPATAVRALAFGLAAWFLLVEAGVQLWYRSHERAIGGTAEWSLRTVEADSGYVRVDTPESVLRQFNADENTELRWQDESGANWQLYYFRWLPAATLQKRVTVQLAKTHGPEKCLPAAGMKLDSDLGLKRVRLGELVLALQHYVFAAQGRPVHVFYAIYEDPSGTEELANRRRDTASRVAAAMAGSRNHSQRFLELAVWGMADEQQAEAALQTELEKLIQLVP